MFIDDTIALVQPKADEQITYPHFYVRRTREYIDAATQYLITKSTTGLLLDFQAANLMQGASFDISKYKSHRKLMPASIGTYAMHLRSFLLWCELKGEQCGDYNKYDFRNITPYKDGIFGSVAEFAHDLETQQFGELKSARAYATRLEITNEFLMFLFSIGERGYYSEFKVSKPRRDFGDQGELKDWCIPSKPEIRDWINSHSTTENQLICELICYAGFRRRDVLNLQVSHVPEIQDIEAADNERVQFKIHKSKRDKSRLTTLPKETYYKLLNYIKKERKQKLKKAGISNPIDNVFVSTYSLNFNNPYSSKKITSLFGKSDFGSKWHPHMGRHAFACHRLIEIIELVAATHQFSFGDALLSTEKHRGGLIKLSSEMGHSQTETTSESYLHWIQDNPLSVDAFRKEF